MLNGVKHEIVEEKDGEGAGENQDPKPEGSAAADVDAEADAAGKKIADSIKKNLGFDFSTFEKTVEKMENFMSRDENSKLKALFNGKDLVKEKDTLTKEEKIVGFFHGLVTKNDAVVKALSEGTAADGGYLFPNEFMAELVKSLVSPTRARSLVRVVTMRRDVMEIPTLASRPKVYWTAENASKTTTTATFSQATLTARKMAAIIYASDELVEDSTEIDVVQTIISLFADAIGIEEDYAILRGNGTTQPTGIFESNAVVTSAASGNLDFDDLIGQVYGLKAQYRNGASFIVHPNNVRELRKLKDSQGRYLWNDSVQQGVPPTLWGYPVHEFYDAPEGEIAFGNFKLGYWLGDRKAMTVKVSNETETAFTKDQTAIRVVARIAGNVVLGEAIHVLTGVV